MRSYAMSRWSIAESGFGRQPHSGSCAMCRCALTISNSICFTAQNRRAAHCDEMEREAATFRHNSFICELSDV